MNDIYTYKEWMNKFDDDIPSNSQNITVIIEDSDDMDSFRSDVMVIKRTKYKFINVYKNINFPYLVYTTKSNLNEIIREIDTQFTRFESKGKDIQKGYKQMSFNVYTQLLSKGLYMVKNKVCIIIMIP